MPSDANGNYSLPDGYLAVTGQTVLASQHNPPLEDLASSMSQRVMATGVKPFTGPIKAADGTVAAPGITFNSAQSTGVYKTTNGIGFSIGGVQVAELVSGGFLTGARFIGELIPCMVTTAQALTVLPYGQTLSRTTYAALWTVAQNEISAGNTFYNNGNGTTTFGIGDLRGRALAGWDSMGGVSANRLTAAAAGVPNGDIIGTTGGSETQQLATANLPAYTPSGTITNGAITFPSATTAGTAGGTVSGITLGTSSGNTNITAMLALSQATTTFSGNAQGGTATAFSLIQPTIICNYLLFAGA